MIKKIFFSYNKNILLKISLNNYYKVLLFKYHIQVMSILPYKFELGKTSFFKFVCRKKLSECNPTFVMDKRTNNIFSHFLWFLSHLTTCLRHGFPCMFLSLCLYVTVMTVMWHEWLSACWLARWKQTVNMRRFRLLQLESSARSNGSEMFRLLVAWGW